MVLLISVLAGFFGIQSTLAVRLLLQNDLSADTTVTSALLLDSQRSTGSEASAACAEYNEQLLSEVNADIQDQLAYLVFRGDLTNSSRIYIGGNGAAGGNASTVSERAFRFNRRQTQQCNAYSVGNATISSVDCTTSLPVLCTNSAPPSGATTNVAPSAGSQVTLSTSNSSFTGYRDSRSFRFLGIPFAQPPVGDLRFRAAQPYNGSYSNVTATSFKNVCIQQPSTGVPAEAISEDCLYLNVYSPILPVSSSNSTAGSGSNATRSLPVAFWIYGGAFTSGSGSLVLYDGGNLASRGDVVVVTINYRLGALGNMASSSNLNGSQGITDQIEALRWVQNHISAFGGDPSRVTIFGESAGAQSVLAIMSSSSATNLYSQAISQSAPWNPFFPRAIYSEAIYPALLNATNCTTSSGEDAQLSCLQALDASVFVNGTAFTSMVGASVVAQVAFSQAGALVSQVEPFLPVVGTGVVDGLTDQLIKNGRLPGAGKPFLVGNMRDEGVLFVDSVPQLQNPIPATNGTLQLLLTSAVDNTTLQAINENSSLFAFNTTDVDALRDLAAEIQTIYVWQCPLQQILNIADESNVFSSLHTYVFDKGVLASSGPASCGPTSPSGIDKVCHSEDLLEVFSSSNVIGTPYSENGGYNSLPFNQYISDVWTSFIRTGDPQPNAEYLRVRGRSYNTTLAWSEATPFNAYTQNSTSSIQLLDGPPRHSGLLNVDQCRVLASSGFLYDNVQAQQRSGSGNSTNRV